jgi:hypothetical protein
MGSLVASTHLSKSGPAMPDIDFLVALEKRRSSFGSVQTYQDVYPDINIFIKIINKIDLAEEGNPFFSPSKAWTGEIFQFRPFHFEKGRSPLQAEPPCPRENHFWGLDLSDLIFIII